MENLRNNISNIPIDPLIAKTYLIAQHELTIDADAAADAASTEAAMDPEKWEALGIDEETARKVAGCVTNSLLPTPGNTRNFSDIISDNRVARIKELEKRAIMGTKQPAIAKNYQPLGKPQVKHITREQLRVELALNGSGSRQKNEQQVA